MSRLDAPHQGRKDKRAVTVLSCPSSSGGDGIGGASRSGRGSVEENLQAAFGDDGDVGTAVAIKVSGYDAEGHIGQVEVLHGCVASISFAQQHAKVRL